MMEFLSDYGIFISLGLTIISDIVLWFRSKIKKTKSEQFDELLKSSQRLIDILSGKNDEEKK